MLTSTKSDDDGQEENKGQKKPIVIRNSTDLQRLKLEKLMQNPVGVVNYSPNNQSHFI